MRPGDLPEGSIYLWTVIPQTQNEPNLKGWLREGKSIVHVYGWNNPFKITLFKRGSTNLDAVTKSHSEMS